MTVWADILAPYRSSRFSPPYADRNPWDQMTPLQRSRRRWQVIERRMSRRFHDESKEQTRRSNSAGELRRDEEFFVDYKLEVIGISVSDVDTAKRFYSDIVGFPMDHDMSPGPGGAVPLDGRAPGLRVGRL